MYDRQFVPSLLEKVFFVVGMAPRNSLIPALGVERQQMVQHLVGCYCTLLDRTFFIDK